MTKKAEAVREANEEELTVNDIMPNPLMEEGSMSEWWRKMMKQWVSF